MGFNKDLSSYLTAYGTYTIGVKAHAEGFRDSETATTTYSNLPVLQYVSETELTFTNVMLGVSQIRLYVDDTLTDAITHDPTSTSDVTIDLTSYNLSSDIHEFYIVVVAPDKTGTSSTFTSETILSAEIFGVSGLYDSSPTLTRTDDAVGMTWVNSNGVFTSDLDNKFPFNVIREVTLDTGDVMVEFPAMWWRVGHDSSNRLTDVAVSKAEGSTGTWYHTPAFQVGKYFTSVSSSTPYSKTNTSMSKFSNIINSSALTQAVNKNMYPITIYHYTILCMLFWIYFANKNSQAVFYRTSSITGVSYTGGMDSFNHMNGIYNNRFKFMYLEDFEGLKYTTLAGVYSNYYFDTYNNQFSIKDYSERSSSGKITLNYTTSTSSGCIAALGWDESHPFICVPTQVVSNSSYNTYFCDSNGNWQSTSSYYSLGSDAGVISTIVSHGMLHYEGGNQNSRLVKYITS